MLGVWKEEAEKRRLSVYCPCCDDEVDAMEWMTVVDEGKAVCPWCSENFFVWMDPGFDPGNFLGLRAHTR